MDRIEARTAVTEALQAEGLLRGGRDHAMAVGGCQRCDTVVEPYLSTQWFVRTRPLADQALEAVASGRVKLVPEFWVATYNHWLENIQDWCISRQLWWGHRIPAWYDADGRPYVGRDEADARSRAGLGADVPLTQDPDVLDTWFSSGLWPFSTLGWPETTDDLRTFYPTSVLITGFDILFFWVARMVMMGCHFAGDIPFHTVHLTGLVRDAEGQKMSKTKGNTIDPLEVCGTYGADAVRFTLAALASPGRDLPLDLKRMEGYRGFATKVWNAARFVQMQLEGDELSLDDLDPAQLGPTERWILSRLSHTARAVDRAWESYRFDDGTHHLYHFIWHTFCDWYLELAKTETDRVEVRSVLKGVLLEALALLHPVMPFITEEIAEHLGHDRMLITSRYPAPRPELEDDELEADLETLQELVGGLRSYRSLVGLPPRHPIAITLLDSAARRAGFLRAQARQLERLAAVSAIEVGNAPEHSVHELFGGMEVALVLPPGSLGATQLERLAKEIAGLEKEREGHTKRLSNEGFLAKAPAEVVAGARTRLSEVETRLARLRQTLDAVTG